MCYNLLYVFERSINVNVCAYHVTVKVNLVIDAAGTVDDEAQLAGLDVAYWLVALNYRNGTELARVQVSASLPRSNGTAVNFDAKNQYDRPVR